ncbi:MAG: ankyrin repeat domain-containing protein [Candidatus Bilamarchaeaceae archaeon]
MEMKTKKMEGKKAKVEKDNQKPKNLAFDTLLEEARRNEIKAKMQKNIELIEAVKKRDKKKISELIMAGADPTKRDILGGYPDEAIIIAKKTQDYEMLTLITNKIIEYFETKGNVEKKEEKDKLNKVLIIASDMFLPLEKIKRLVELGAKPDSQYKDFENGQSAFIKCAIKGNIVAANYFKDYIKNISHEDRDGKTAMMHAMAHRHDDIRWLIFEEMEKRRKSPPREIEEELIIPDD